MANGKKNVMIHRFPTALKKIIEFWGREQETNLNFSQSMITICAKFFEENSREKRRIEKLLADAEKTGEVAPVEI